MNFPTYPNISQNFLKKINNKKNPIFITKEYDFYSLAHDIMR
jgi:hypothetical protein